MVLGVFCILSRGGIEKRRLVKPSRQTPFDQFQIDIDGADAFLVAVVGKI